jgi:hypothetical protein
MADFVFSSDFSFKETPRFQTLVSSFENGAEQRRAKRSAPLREFEFNIKNRSAADFVYVRDFFISKKGRLTPFTWVNHNDGVEYTVRFKDDEIPFALVHAGLYDFSFTLIEVG